MKNNIRKIIGILLVGVISMYLWTGVVFADTAPINLDSDVFKDVTSNSIESTPANNTSTPINNTTSNVTSNSTILPQTGSNTEIIFIIGITVLAGTAITLYNKTKIK